MHRFIAVAMHVCKGIIGSVILASLMLEVTQTWLLTVCAHCNRKVSIKVVIFVVAEVSFCEIVLVLFLCQDEGVILGFPIRM